MVKNHHSQAWTLVKGPGESISAFKRPIHSGDFLIQKGEIFTWTLYLIPAGYRFLQVFLKIATSILNEDVLACVGNEERQMAGPYMLADVRKGAPLSQFTP